MSTGILAVLDGVMGALNGGDVSAVADPAELHPPAVLLAVDSLAPDVLLDGSGSVTLRLNLCVPNAAWRDALTQLDDLLQAVAALIDLDSTAFPETLLVAGVGEVPTFRVTTTQYYERA